MTNREPGFYWINQYGWFVGELSAEKEGLWLVAGNPRHFSEESFAEIGPRVLTPEEVSRLHSRIAELEGIARQVVEGHEALDFDLQSVAREARTVLKGSE